MFKNRSLFIALILILTVGILGGCTAEKTEAPAEAVKELLERADCFAGIAIEKDFNNNDRVVIARKSLS